MSNDTATSATFLINALQGVVGLAALEVSLLSDWWQREGRKSESMAAFLEREGLLITGAARTVDLIAKGYLAAENLGSLLTPGARQRIVAKLAESVAAVPDSPEVPEPAPPVPQPMFVTRPPAPQQAPRPPAAIPGAMTVPPPARVTPPKPSDETVSLRRGPLGETVADDRPADSPVQAGRIFGQYRIVSRRAAGPVGAVWTGEDMLLGKPVAVKLVPAKALDGAGQAYIQRALAASRVLHPHALPLLTAGQSDDQFFLVMPLLEGGSALDRVANSGPCDPAEATRWCRQAAEALQAAHAAGVIHGNVKPSNLLIDGQDVRLADFGTAFKANDARATPRSTSSLRREFDRLRRADLRALAQTYHFLLTSSWPAAAPVPGGSQPGAAP